MRYGKVFVVSPIREFHRYSEGSELTERNIRILQNTIRWAADQMEIRGIDVRTVLDLAQLPSDVTAYAVRRLLATKTWNTMMENETHEAIDWCDAVALMPECGNVRSPYVQSVREYAEEHFRPVVGAEEIIGIDEGDFKRQIFEIENALSGVHRRKKVLMKGARTK